MYTGWVLIRFRDFFGWIPRAVFALRTEIFKGRLYSPETRDNRAVKWSVWWILWQMNHFCTFYVIRTDLWDNFYFDSVFAYCSKGTYKYKEIVVAIFKMSLKIQPKDKMLLRSKTCKWNGFQEQFSSFLLQTATGKTFILSTASPREHSFRTNLNNKHINCFYSVSPLEQLANILSK